MPVYLPKRVAKKNAARITELADTFGHLEINLHGQTVASVCNLSIPCAYLIHIGLVSQVVDSYDTVNDGAVAEIERYCAIAVSRQDSLHGTGWWSEEAKRLGLPKVSEVSIP